jgi:SAM-dependent methyltransferase
VEVDDMENIDLPTVTGFGAEWSRFDQSGLSPEELERTFQMYFGIFPWERLGPAAVGFDLGCGSGRWARLVAPRVGRLHCVDPSASALAVAERNLAGLPNCTFHRAGVDELPFADESMDFAYSLGVLHHVPDTARGIRGCVRKLKPGAPLLLYLYYAFDNRPPWYRWLWRGTDAVRRLVSRLPAGPRFLAADLLAGAVYLPLARAARLAERMGGAFETLPLSFYRNASFYVMRTDALDRFGTRLEQRFTAAEVRAMMAGAGLENITFSASAPYWCAIGWKALAGSH